MLTPLRLALAVLAFAAGLARAEPIVLPAVDFPVIDAGEVPYYVDAPREALAIDAAVLAYRDRPARASVPFAGEGGRYDVTLTALAEIDGETTYRVLVDGAVVASVTNTPVALEFAEQAHRFEDVEVPTGAMLAVESSAVSNEQIPENGEFAFARGRWTTLTLVPAEADGGETETPIDGNGGGETETPTGESGGGETGAPTGESGGGSETAAPPVMPEPTETPTMPGSSGPFEPVTPPGTTAPTSSPEDVADDRSSGGGALGGLALVVLGATGVRRRLVGVRSAA